MKKILTVILVLAITFSMLVIPAHAAGFPDIESHWAKADIEAMADAGYLNGYPNGTFRPDAPVSHSEFAKIICEAYGLPTGEYGWKMYDDTNEGDWYAPYIPAFFYLVFNSFADEVQSDWDTGISTAFTRALGDGYGWLFNAEKPLTRVEAAAGIMRCAVFPDESEAESFEAALDAVFETAAGSADIEDFNDSLITMFYAGLAIQRGIMTGDGQGRFRPYDTISRAELCAVLSRALSMYGGKADPYAVEVIGALNEALAEMYFEETFEEAYEGATQPESAYDTPPYTGEFDDWAEEVLRLVNIERANEGIGPLELDKDLCAVAQLHSDDMVARGFFSHENPDGQDPFDRMWAYGISFMAAAENIAAGQRSPEEVVDSWMHSPGHRANILNPTYKKMGVAYTYGGAYGIYWAQCFTN